MFFKKHKVVAKEASKSIVASHCQKLIMKSFRLLGWILVEICLKLTNFQKSSSARELSVFTKSPHPAPLHFWFC